MTAGFASGMDCGKHCSK